VSAVEDNEPHDYCDWLRYATEYGRVKKEKQRFAKYFINATDQLDGICGETWMEVVRWCLECFQKEVTQQKYFEYIVQRLDYLKM